nr:uncharacterized protein LOC126521589 [Dermacentor andersoni]
MSLGVVAYAVEEPPGPRWQGAGETSIELSSVSRQDVGTYRCRADNGLGQISADIQLVVRDARPSLRSNDLTDLDFILSWDQCGQWTWRPGSAMTMGYLIWSGRRPQVAMPCLKHRTRHAGCASTHGINTSLQTLQEAARKPEARKRRRVDPLLRRRNQKEVKGTRLECADALLAPAISLALPISLETAAAASPGESKHRLGDSKVARNRPADGEESHFRFAENDKYRQKKKRKYNEQQNGRSRVPS